MLLALIGIVALNYSFKTTIGTSMIPQPLPPNQSTFDQNPPYPIGFWVKKLARATANGENLIFKVKYESDQALPSKIEYYQQGHIRYTLLDNGTYPDDVAGDKKYACLKKEDFKKLKAEISALEHTIHSQGNVVHFTGHSGEVILESAIKHFDVTGFDNGDEVEVNALLIDAVNCGAEIKLEKSLFITDLSVVEDQSRTYNVFTGVGNPTGAWTFGALIANMENGTHPDGVRGFLKDWVKSWTVNQTVNGQVVKSRDYVIETFITPWLQKAQNNTFLSVTLQNWESIWNATNQTALVNNAPFKLTTIVNRLDLRGNSAYSSGLGNTGETRFIYTLVNPITGEIPIAPTQTGEHQNIDPAGFVDWRGFNVILEYGNVQQTSCDAQNLAQMWLDLSDNSLPMGNATTNNDYKDALQVITDFVTTANSKPGKPNGSAINRIRTNEKLFATFNNTPADSDGDWEVQDWEFRQFEIDGTTHKLKMVPLTNNPPVTANYAPNIQEDYLSSSPSISNHAVLDWIYNGFHKLQVQNGNFNLPTNLLAGSGIVRREQTSFFGFDPAYWVTKSNYNVSEESVEATQIRQQFSLNTCVGCHAGETKTKFTQVDPVKYNELVRYWLSSIDGSNGTQDNALYPWGTGPLMSTGGRNNGTTTDVNATNIPNYNFKVDVEIKGQTFFQNVSPFLTGRRFRSAFDYQTFTPNWQDDNLDPTDNLKDETMEGLFYVNDPSNGTGYFPSNTDKKWGYNDLMNRKNKLCQFLLANCGEGPNSNDPTAIQMITQISFIPFPLASH